MTGKSPQVRKLQAIKDFIQPRTYQESKERFNHLYLSIAKDDTIKAQDLPAYEIKRRMLQLTKMQDVTSEEKE